MTTEVVEPVLQNRQALANYFTLSRFAQDAEIDMDDGIYARTLLERNAQLKLIAVDPWDAGGGNRRGEESFVATYTALAQFIQLERVDILRMSSQDAATLFADGALDFVFIDAAHDYDSVSQDIALWAPKVRAGGIVSGHDYYTVKNGPVKSGVMRAVDEYVASHGIDLQTTPWDRRNPDRDSRQPCWWFWRGVS